MTNATTTQSAFLNVERSAMGRRWLARLCDDRLALALAQSHGLPELVARVMASRGVGLDDAPTWLTPTLKSLLPDPCHLKDMETAARRVADAVRAGERIAVFGDYDVDGATSSALLRRFLRAVGTEPVVYIPDRIKEGYGPNSAALLRLKEEHGVGLVVTVDCGTTAFEPLEAASKAGLDVVVVDHHAAEARLPRALAVVNPNRLDDTSPHKTLCAVGVTFLLAIAVNRLLRQAGWYGADRPEPDLLGWLDLVALGTVCDVVPLVGLNRALVAQGLRVMGRRSNAGISALSDLCKLTERPTAYHAGFVFGPRVNAGGRVGAADLGVRLLSTEDAGEAARLAQQLDGHNTERRAVEAAVLREAIEQVEAHPKPRPELVFVVGQGWHPGVIGIVAARLKERYNRAACVVSLEAGIGKASGRSVRGIDLGAAVIAARQAGLLLNGGGHPMAAGFTVESGSIDRLEQFLADRIREQQAMGGPLVPTMEVDGALSVGGVTPQLVALLSRLGPFGTGNSEPRFAIPDARIARADVVGGNHVRCFVTAGAGTATRLKAIAFRALDSELGRLLLTSGGAPLHLAGYLRADNWNGAEGVQLMIEDAAPIWSIASGSKEKA